MIFPWPFRSCAQPARGEHAAVVVVGRDVADDLRRLERRVDDHDRNPPGDRLLDRLDQRLANRAGRARSRRPRWRSHSARAGSAATARPPSAAPARSPRRCPAPRPPSSAPAWIVFQNSWVVPLGITITRHFFFSPVDPASARFSACGGWSSSAIAGSFMFSGVTSVSPVEILAGDLLLLEVIDERLDPELTHPVGVLDDEALELSLLERVDQRLAGVEADECHALDRRGAPAGVPGFAPSGAPASRSRAARAK